MQAASIQTLFVGSVLITVVRRLLEPFLPETELQAIGLEQASLTPERMIEKYTAIPGMLSRNLDASSELAKLEIDTYRRGGNFFSENRQ